VTDAKLVERLLEVKGRRIRYFVAGSGPPLVLVHGLGGSAANWCELVPLLAGHRRVIVPDLPGHGGSEALPAVASLGAFADRVAAVAGHEQALPAPVVGHSLGGVVVLHLALRRPDAVTSLVLAAAAGLSTGTTLQRSLLSASMVLRPGRLVARHSDRIARSRLLRRATFGRYYVADPVGLTDAALRGFLAGHLLHTDLATAWRALRRDDPREGLEDIRSPVLVLWGALDAQLPLEDAFEYTRRLRARLRVIPECGHLLIGERPDACADAILSFV
jgi:pyruvate dehydrogenase E2 component (dihydrolipoyllysine-residue acetyltransferase)